MHVGDLISMTGFPEIIGIIIYRHPTKGVVKVYWPNDDPSWESCARLKIISSCDQNRTHLPH